MRIRDVVKESGVSRELIHHYLRQGILPQPEERGRYSDRHVSLLRLLKKMREDHHLPLEAIRSVFEIYDFDPGHLETFTLTDSLHKRLADLSSGGDVFSQTLSSAEIVAHVGVSPDRLGEYVSARMVRPVRQDNEERFSVYDMNVIALCERGTRLGIPFDSLRNISAYVRVAFELEHKFLFEVARKAAREQRKVLGEIFVRQEVITGFIQNLVQSMICQRLLDLVSLGREVNVTMESILYRPSAAFVSRHGLEGAIDVSQEALCQAPDDPDRWSRTGRLMLHAGRYREACFFLEKALEKWPGRAGLLTLHGKALLLSGRPRRALETLRAQTDSGDPDPMALVFEALCLLNRAGGPASGEPLVSDGVQILERVEQALEAVEGAAWDSRTEVRMISGWALNSVPSSLPRSDHGMEVLTETYNDLTGRTTGDRTLPGFRERYLINTAYLILRCRHGTGTRGVVSHAPTASPADQDLCNVICTLDPASAFAERAFLESWGH